MIELQQVSFGYPRCPLIFENFTWQVAQGEAWVVLGASGCGKTTLLYLLAGLQQPVSGVIRVGGDVLDRPRPRTGLILQDYGLLPWATVRENVSLGLRVRQFYGPDGLHAPSGEVVTAVSSKVDYWLDQLGLVEASQRYPGQISGGQRQRTAIARTLVLNPDLLLMDEPFASLDVPTRESLQGFVRDLNQERGLTTVLVTHSIEEAALLGRHVLVLGLPPNRQARVVENPSTEPGSSEFQTVCRALRQLLEADS